MTDSRGSTSPGANRSSPLRELCENLRLTLLSIISPPGQFGAPVFGPVLIFLEDPKEGVLRPATKVEWDDLRLEPVLDDLLALILSRLTALRNALVDPANRDALQAFEKKYAELRPGLSDQAPIDEALNALESAWADVEGLLLPRETGRTAGQTHDIDDVLRPDTLTKLGHRLNTVADLVSTLFQAVGQLSRQDATALGAPQTSRLHMAELVSQIRYLALAAQGRWSAWHDLRLYLKQLNEKDIANYDEVVARENLLTTSSDGVNRRLREFASLSEEATSIVALRNAIRLFQVAPQEIGSSVAYMMLQWHNVSQQAEGKEFRDFDLSELAFRPGRRHTKHEYSEALIDKAALYQVTHRLERLFYGPEKPLSNSNESTTLSVIRNIVFIPIRYFDGQVIGQVVVIPPFKDLNLRLVYDTCRHFLGEIGIAVQGELVSTVQRKMRDLFEPHEDTGKVDRDAVIRVVSDTLASMVSVRSILGFRYLHEAKEHCLLYAARRLEGVQPQDLVLTYLGEPVELNAGGWSSERWRQEASRLSAERFLEDGLTRIGPSQRALKILLLKGEKTRRILELNKRFQSLEESDEISVGGGSWTAWMREGAFGDPVMDRGLIAEIKQLIEDISRREIEPFAPVVGTLLLLWVPLHRPTKDGTPDEYAVFVLELWEPHAVVSQMETGLLTAARVGVESCNTFLLELADNLGAEKASATDQRHALSNGSDLLTYAAHLQNVDRDSLENRGFRHVALENDASDQLSMFYERVGQAMKQQDSWFVAQSEQGTQQLQNFLFDETLPQYRAQDLLRHLTKPSWCLAMGRTQSLWSDVDPVTTLSRTLDDTQSRVHWLGPATFIEELARNNVATGRRFALWGMPGRMLGALADRSSGIDAFPSGTLPNEDDSRWALVYSDNDPALIPWEHFNIGTARSAKQQGTRRVAALALAVAQDDVARGRAVSSTLVQFRIDQSRMADMLATEHHRISIPYVKIIALLLPSAL